jgi:hypothetical protein
MNIENSPFTMDKTSISFTSTHDDSDDVSHWHSKTASERLAALEFLRQVMFGYDPVTTRLQRIIEFTELE